MTADQRAAQRDRVRRKRARKVRDRNPWRAGHYQNNK